VLHDTAALHPENIDAGARTANSRERRCSALSNRLVFRQIYPQLRAMHKKRELFRHGALLDRDALPVVRVSRVQPDL